MADGVTVKTEGGTTEKRTEATKESESTADASKKDASSKTKVKEEGGKKVLSKSRSRSRSRKRTRSRSRSRSRKRTKSRSYSRSKKRKKRRSSRSRSRKKRRRSRSRSRKKKRRRRSRSRSRSKKKKKRKRRKSKSRSRSKKRAKSPSKSSKRSKSRPKRTKSYSKSPSPVVKLEPKKETPKPKLVPTITPTQALLQNLQTSALNSQIMQMNKKGPLVLPEITRPARRLYIGNLPPNMGITEMVLTQFFTECSRGLGITTKSPVISSWLNPDQTFGFVEMRSVQDTTLALSLFQGLQLGGRQLKFGRPVDYKVPAQHLQNYVIPIPGEDTEGKNPCTVADGTPAAMLAKLQRAHVNMDSVEDGILSKDAPLGAVSEAAKRTAKALVAKKTTGEHDKNMSKILVLENLMRKSYYFDDSEFDDVVDDIRVECYNLSLGSLEEVVVPRPGGETGDKGILRVFLVFDSLDGANRVKAKVTDREFENQRVDAWFFPTKYWESRELDALKDGTLPKVEVPVQPAINAPPQLAIESKKTITQQELEAELLGAPPGL